jgi:CRP-like cAMP-binding protein
MSSLLFGLLENPEFSEGVYWRRLHIDANRVVFHEGETGREIYLILSGVVRIVGNVDLDEKHRIKPGFCELSQGDLFGELAAFDDAPRSATVVAVSDVELAVMDGVALLQFLDEHPEIAYPIAKELITTLVLRLRKANQRIFSLFAWGLKSRGIDEHL